MKTLEQKKQHLLDLGFIIGERNPMVNTNHKGSYMVVEEHDASELPTTDGSAGPWAIVGNDLNELIEEAYAAWKEMDFDPPPKFDGF